MKMVSVVQFSEVTTSVVLFSLERRYSMVIPNP